MSKLLVILCCNFIISRSLFFLFIFPKPFYTIDQINLFEMNSKNVIIKIRKINKGSTVDSYSLTV